MSLVLSEEATEYRPPEAGTFPARCVSLIDMGTQASTYEGETKHARKVLVSFEILDADNRRDDGTAFLVSKRFTASLHPKSALRAFLKAWRGRDFTPDELKAFDLKHLLGVACLLSIVHVEKGDRTYANISGAMKLPRGMQAPEGTLPRVSFDLGAPDWQAYAGLSSRLQEQIAASPEYKGAKAPARVELGGGTPASETAPPDATPPPAGDGFDDLDEGIPF